MKEAILPFQKRQLSTEILLPFASEEINPNLSGQEKKRLLLEKTEEAYGLLLRAYLPAIVWVANCFFDPRPVRAPFKEKVLEGMFGLWRGQLRFEDREGAHPDQAVFLSIRQEIKRATLGPYNEFIGEAKQTVLIDDLTTSGESDVFPLETLKIEQESHEEVICNQLSLSQLFMAVADSYRNHCQNGLKQGQKNIERNLTIFYFVFWQKYDYPVNGGGPYPNKRIARAFGLKTQRVQQIYYEVRNAILADPEFRAHFAEMLGLSAEEIEQKIKSVIDQ